MSERPDNLALTSVQNNSGQKHGYQSLESNGSQLSNHCHMNDAVESQVDKSSQRKLVIASILCLIFFTGETIGGVLSNSLAILTDAAHMLSDFASFMISLFAIFLASRPATKTMSFGWHRAEVIGALISVLMIWLVTGILVYLAIERIITKEYDIKAKIMLITASCGIIMNLIMGATLHTVGHDHSHGGGLPDQEENGNPAPKPATPTEKQLNVRAAFIHVLGDLLQSVGVFIAALVIFFKPEWKIADPLCTFLFSILVLLTTLTIMRDIMNVLMEGAPRGIKFNDVKEDLLRLDGVKFVHNVRLWSLTVSKVAVSAHIAVDTKKHSSQMILKDAAEMLRSKYDIVEMTIQIEDYDEDMENCFHCQDPHD